MPGVLGDQPGDHAGGVVPFGLVPGFLRRRRRGPEQCPVPFHLFIPGGGVVVVALCDFADQLGVLLVQLLEQALDRPFLLPVRDSLFPFAEGQVFQPACGLGLGLGVQRLLVFHSFLVFHSVPLGPEFPDVLLWLVFAGLLRGVFVPGVQYGFFRVVFSGLLRGVLVPGVQYGFFRVVFSGLLLCPLGPQVPEGHLLLAAPGLSRLLPGSACGGLALDVPFEQLHVPGQVSLPEFPQVVLEGARFGPGHRVRFPPVPLRPIRLGQHLLAGGASVPVGLRGLLLPELVESFHRLPASLRAPGLILGLACRVMEVEAGPSVPDILEVLLDEAHLLHAVLHLGLAPGHQPPFDHTLDPCGPLRQVFLEGLHHRVEAPVVPHLSVRSLPDEPRGVPQGLGLLVHGGHEGPGQAA